MEGGREVMIKVCSPPSLHSRIGRGREGGRDGEWINKSSLHSTPLHSRMEGGRERGREGEE